MDIDRENIMFYIVAVIALFVAVMYTRGAVIKVAAITCKDLVEYEVAEIQEQLEIEIERNRELEALNVELKNVQWRLEEINKRQKEIIFVQKQLINQIKNRINEDECGDFTGNMHYDAFKNKAI